MLKSLVKKFRTKKVAVTSDTDVPSDSKVEFAEKDCQEKEDIIANLNEDILLLERELSRKQSTIAERDEEIRTLSEEVNNGDKFILRQEKERCRLRELLERVNSERIVFQREIERLKKIIKRKETLPSKFELEQRVLMENIEDQKFVFNAKEDRMQLPSKQINDLSEYLVNRTKVLGQTRCALASCKGKLREATTFIEKQNKEICRLNEEVKSLIQILQTNEDLLTMQTARIRSLEDDIEQVIVRRKEDLIREMISRKANCISNDIKFLKRDASSVEAANDRDEDPLCLKAKADVTHT